MNDPIKQKIQELVPEIMELKFGCQIMAHEDMKDTFVCAILAKHGNEYVVTHEGFNGHTASFGENAGFSVIGRPITLANILRAIPNKEIGINGIGVFIRDFAGEASENMGAVWDLRLDYDHQSPETKAFIGTLLGVTGTN